MWGVLLLLLCGSLAFAQAPPPPSPESSPESPPAAPSQPLSPEQLDNLVAPIALYPDSLLSQILVASTYPLEIVEAEQWLQQNSNLTGQQQLDAARKQNWDASVQALICFPEVLARLNQDIHWTTDLGNAFLAQQADVMSAVQRMRARAQANGKLQSTPQETVQTQNQNGQTAIAIQPTDPQVVYVPSYNPAYIWGPPVYGYYPPLYYPAVGFGFGFLPGISIGAYFGGFGLWGGYGWGWGPNWFGGNIIVNNNFFHRYGFHEFHGPGGGVWAHNPEHRLGVPYANRAVANRFGGGAAFRGGGAAFNRGNFAANSERSAGRNMAPTQRFGSSGFERQNSGGNRSVFGGIQNGGQTRMQSDHGFATMHGGFGGGGGFHGGGGGGTRGGGRR